MLREVQDLLDRLRGRAVGADGLDLTAADVLAVLVLLVGSAGLTAAVWWANQPVAVSPPVIGPSAPAEVGGPLPDPLQTGPTTEPPPDGSLTAGASSGMADVVVVHVAGHVVRPGVVTLPAGSRVADAVAAAGGVTSAAVVDALNLARVLVDGEQVRVPAAGEEVAPAPAGSSADGAGAGGDGTGDGVPGPIDLNRATAADLDALPGVGPVLAQRIIDHRTAIGGFADVAQLLEVPGIGAARFAELEPRVRV